MTPEQLERQMKKAGFMTQVAFAEFVGVRDRQVRRWLAGKAPIPGCVVRLLRAMLRYDLREEDLQ